MQRFFNFFGLLGMMISFSQTGFAFSAEEYLDQRAAAFLKEEGAFVTSILKGPNAASGNHSLKAIILQSADTTEFILLRAYLFNESPEIIHFETINAILPGRLNIVFHSGDRVLFRTDKAIERVSFNWGAQHSLGEELSSICLEVLNWKDPSQFFLKQESGKQRLPKTSTDAAAVSEEASSSEKLPRFSEQKPPNSKTYETAAAPAAGSSGTRNSTAANIQEFLQQKTTHRYETFSALIENLGHAGYPAGLLNLLKEPLQGEHFVVSHNNHFYYCTGQRQDGRITASMAATSRLGNGERLHFVNTQF